MPLHWSESKQGAFFPAAKRALIYVFRPEKLGSDLAKKNAKQLLCEMGYPDDRMLVCLQELIHRLNSRKDFPHEIGLFLGYPNFEYK